MNNTNNNCVNNSCDNTVINYSNPVVVASNPLPYNNEFTQMSIQKQVRELNGGSYQNSISANVGDTVQFQIIVTNTGNQPVNNVVVTDNLPA